MTLLELLIAVSIMSMLVGTLAIMADAVYQSTEYSHNHGLAVQHARVVLDRIERTVNGATASGEYCGAMVLDETLGGWRFPHTLVVWHPASAPANPEGPPLVGELVIYSPNPSVPNELLEITSPGDMTAAPAAGNTAAWISLVNSLRTSSASKKTLLTDLLRVGTVPEGGSPVVRQGAVRFELAVFPSPAQWTDYKNGALDWDELPWVQDIFGSQTGLRQTWVRMELQLTPGSIAEAYAPEVLEPIPFFGSAALYYELHR